MSAKTAAISLVLLLTLLPGCRQETPVHTTRFNAFGAVIDLSLVGVEQKEAERASEMLKQDFAFMHHAWHAWEPGPLGRVNQELATGGSFVSPPSLLPLIRSSKTLAELSDNLFNPAIGHLIDQWGFHTDSPECRPPPSRARIRELVRSNPRMSDVVLDGIQLRGTNPAVKLDFGAIGKGYGIDLAVDHLRALGIRDALVNAGGDLRAIGDRGGQPWRIAVRRPTGSGVFAILQIKGDESVFTSGGSDRNFVYEGVTYHHIIDPRTGFPADGTQSVTVVHTDATTADAAATALFVAGPKRWHEIALRLGIRYVLLVDHAGTVHMNPAMRDRIELLDKSVNEVISAPLLDVAQPVRPGNDDRPAR